MNFSYDTLAIRVKAFVFQAGAMFLATGLTLLINVLQSNEFTQLVIEHFGEFWGAGIGVMVINAIVSHLHNLRAIYKYENSVGGAGEPPVLI